MDPSAKQCISEDIHWWCYTNETCNYLILQTSSNEKTYLKADIRGLESICSSKWCLPYDSWGEFNNTCSHDFEWRSKDLENTPNMRAFVNLMGGGVSGRSRSSSDNRIVTFLWLLFYGGLSVSQIATSKVFKGQEGKIPIQFCPTAGFLPQPLEWMWWWWWWKK